MRYTVGIQNFEKLRKEKFLYVDKTKLIYRLVDEYDKPILQTLHNKDLQENYRNELKAFYSILKNQDQYIRFAFLTSVTKFGKMSVFSDLNNHNTTQQKAARHDGHPHLCRLRLRRTTHTQH